MTQAQSMVIDVGGTNTRIGLANGPNVKTASVRTFKNADFNSLYSVITAFGDAPFSQICVDWAGPVKDGRGTLTNLPWTVSEDELCLQTGAKKALIINDLQAQGYALDKVDPDHIQDVMPGTPATNGTRLVVNVGTGFNASPVYSLANRPFVPENEAGHVALAIPPGIACNAQTELAGTDGFLSVEDVLSGRGLARVLRTMAPSFEGDPGTVFPHFLKGPTPELTVALGFFVKILGQVAGDLALTHLPRGGVYLVGGVAMGAAPVLANLGFADAFRSKGRFTDFMDGFSVHVNMDPLAALKGCAVALRAQADQV